jgi:hypothetical protein
MNHALADLQDLQFTTRDLVDRLRTLCGDDEEAFLDTLDGEADTTEAARRVLRWANEQEAAAESMKGLSATYASRAAVLLGRKDGARTALFHFLEYLGVKSMQLPEGTLSIRAGTAQLVGEVDPASLPDDLVRIKREPDKTAIKKALEGGREVPGYTLSNGAPSLSVRVR